MNRSTRIVSIDRDAPDESLIREAAAILRSGGLVAFATETVYGLAADATNAQAVAAIFKAKGRPAYNPLIVHASDAEMAQSCVSPAAALCEGSEPSTPASRLVRAFWPGPLTLVLPRSQIIPDIVTGGLATVGVRVPEPKIARALIACVGRPLAAPSANRSMGVSPTLARHVQAGLAGRIDLIIDSGPTTLGLESTVLDLTSGEPRILRPGPVTVAMIERVLKTARVRDFEPARAAPPEQPMSPGRLSVHYAPRTRAVRVDDSRELSSFPWPAQAIVVVLGPHDVSALPAAVERFNLPTPDAAARELYGVLHQCDERGVDLIVLVPPPDLPEWSAVRDRVARAARPWNGGDD